MKKNSNFHSNRIIFLLVLFLLISFVIFSRLFYVQVVKSEEYTKMALEQINRSEEIVSDRGYIYDRNGKRLAINIAASTVYVNSQYIKDEETKKVVAKELAPLVQISENELLERISTDNRIKIRQWVDSDAAMRIREKGLSGVEVVDGFRRSYPYGNLASHLIGFANVDGVGQYGVEASYNEELSGSPGRIFKSSDAGNRPLPNSNMEVHDADDGLSAVLTIDQSIQSIAEEETNNILEKFQPDGVHIIVQEVESGDILAMHSYPSFDGNEPTQPVSQEQVNNWKNMSSEEIQNDWYKNWRNPIISNIYEPGSTFKLITAAAGLEENTTDPDKHYYCTGYIRDIKNAPILRCVSYDDPHGDITLREALAHSCNPTFVYLNRDTGRENFMKYVRAFGFGERTGIDLNGEGIGIIPQNPDDISELSFATMSYGHGIAVTPIQLINAVSAIGNDGILMKPRVVKELINSDGNSTKTIEITQKRQVVSKETSERLLDMMFNVVENGTATKTQSPLYKIGGKTGTPNKVEETGGYYEDRYVSSIVGLAPIEDPKVSVLVIVDNPKNETYGSIVAAPSAQNLIEYSLKILGVSETPRDIEENIDNNLVQVPDVTYRLIGEGGSVLSNLGLKYTTGYDKITEESIITKQSIVPGEMVEKGTILEIELDLNESDNKILPNFIGKNITDVDFLLEKMNINYKLEGSEEGFIAYQSIDPGTRINSTQELILTLDENLETKENQNIDSSLKDGLLEIENVELDIENDSQEQVEEDDKDEVEDSNNN